MSFTIEEYKQRDGVERQTSVTETHGNHSVTHHKMCTQMYGAVRR